MQPIVFPKSLLFAASLAAVACVGIFACASPARDDQTPMANMSSAPQQQQPPAQDAIMSLEEARVYMLDLINGDRTAHGLNPVQVDPVATTAGQRHTDEMARNGFISHWNKNGKKPDQRYTESGGIHCNTENLAFRTFRGATPSTDSDGKKTSKDGGGVYALHGVQAFRQSDLDKMQRAFMAEKPPRDGHRRCILDPVHNYVGIGLSLSSNGQENYRIALAQEFTNIYGQYDPIQQMCTRGQSITLSGRLNPGYEVYEVMFDYDPLPNSMDFKALDKTVTYAAGKKRMYRYWPPNIPQDGTSPLQTSPLPDGRQQFYCAILPKDWKPGIYYACVMAKPVNADYTTAFMVSRRTVIIPPD
jgi:uncharacterized protein YkwD